MTETFVALFFAHVLADYVFQSKSMVAHKKKPHILLLHGTIVLTLSMLATGQWFVLPLLTLAGVHLAIDTVKSHLVGDSFRPHALDQLLHLATLGLTSLIWPSLWQTGIWAPSPAWVLHAMLLFAGLIYTTRAGGFAIGKLMQPYAETLPKMPPAYDMAPQNDTSLQNGGAMIGHLERGLIYALMLSGMQAGIGFLIAAKSVLRFDAKSDNRKAEYVIIGTLASFGWAILVSIAVISLRKALPAL